MCLFACVPISTESFDSCVLSLSMCVSAYRCVSACLFVPACMRACVCVLRV